ncbi:MAG: hypothetical protein IJW22_07930 [Clostridia bacterium]|nr:hypothetical protein [Clostridia bacterium]
MSEYIKKTWADGDVITPEALNNIETGIAEAKKDAEQTSIAAGNAQSAADDAQSAADDAQSAADNAQSAADKARYPIGSLFVDPDDPTEPNERGIEGTWEKVPEGHTIIGAGSTYTAGSTGGSKTVTIAETNLPHQRGYLAFYSDGASKGVIDGSCFTNSSFPNNVFSSSGAACTAAGIPATSSSSTTAYRAMQYDNRGNSTPMDIMQPYVAYHAWVRIA